ncbi:MAG: tetratricopeptide repeat protein [Spirochaetales bacterium]|nr:tetratricopeptide repeat protein [Spirochaetales bacterium]
MNKKTNPILDRIMYISIPEDSEQEINGFQIDSSILMPVEIPLGESDWQMQDLSWEMIVAAMLKIFAWDPSHKDIEYYRSFIHAVQPGINEEMTQSGIIKAGNKDYEIAEEIFRALANYKPDIEQNLTNLAFVFEEQTELYANLNNPDLAEKKIEEAFKTYKRAIRQHPNSEEVFFNGGNFYLKHGNMEKAVELLNHFIDITKDQKKKELVKGILSKIKNISVEDITFNEAYELIKIGREESGIKKIEQYLQNQPDIWNAWFLLGWAYRRIGNYEKGKVALLKCLELNEENVDTYNELSICYLELGEYNECRKKLAKALRIDGDNIKIISNFGILALKENNSEEAMGFFRTVLEIEPDDEIAKKYIEFLSKNQ